MTENEFCAIVADYLAIDRREVVPESRLREDLAFDSLQLFEVGLMLEDSTSGAIPEELLPQVLTVADVYHYYVLFSQR